MPRDKIEAFHPLIKARCPGSHDERPRGRRGSSLISDRLGASITNCGGHPRAKTRDKPIAKLPTVSRLAALIPPSVRAPPRNPASRRIRRQCPRQRHKPLQIRPEPSHTHQNVWTAANPPIIRVIREQTRSLRDIRDRLKRRERRRRRPSIDHELAYLNVLTLRPFHVQRRDCVTSHEDRRPRHSNLALRRRSGGVTSQSKKLLHLLTQFVRHVNTPSILKRGVRNQDRARLIKASQERVDGFGMLTNRRCDQRSAHLIKGCKIPLQAITIPLQGTTKVKEISIRQNGNIRSIERVREHHKDLSLKTEEKRDICSDTSKCSMYSTHPGAKQWPTHASRVKSAASIARRKASSGGAA